MKPVDAIRSLKIFFVFGWLLASCLPCLASAPTAPDVSLTDADISFSNDFPKSGENVIINVTVHNIGGMVSGAVSVRFYTDQDIVPFSEKTIANIDANMTAVTATNWFATIPKAYTIKVKLECTADTNTANNNAQKPLTVNTGGALDVKIKLDPVACAPGQVFFVNGTVKQLNSQPVPAATVAISVKPAYASTSVTTDTNGDFFANFTAPAAAGKYEVEASATSGSLKGNDTKTLHVVLPDLLVSNLVFSAKSPQEGDTVVITVTLQNNGTAAASNIQVAFYYDATKIGTRTIARLDGDNSTIVTVNWKAVKGSHTIRAAADPDKKIDESDDNNNAVSAPLTVKEKPGGVGDGNSLLLIGVVTIVVAAVGGLLLIRRRKAK